MIKAFTTDTLGGRIANDRIARGWTRKDLERESGVTEAALEKIENGKSDNPRELEQIAEALGKHPAYYRYNLSPESIALAMMWEKLPEQQKKAMESTITNLAGEIDLNN